MKKPIFIFLTALIFMLASSAAILPGSGSGSNLINTSHAALTDQRTAIDQVVQAEQPRFSTKCPVGQIMIKNTCFQPTPDQGLKLLLDGNKEFAKGQVPHLYKYTSLKVRQEVAVTQHPFAVVLTCSDSRVPPEILFDKGLGEIFTVRVAGNVVSPHELGSIEYALEHLGANLIVVLGHERCGAVRAAYDSFGTVVEGNIGSLVNDIMPAVENVLGGNPKPAGTDAQAQQVEQCVVENVNLVGESLEDKSPIIKEFVETGKAKIVQAKYDLEDGLVTVLQQ